MTERTPQPNVVQFASNVFVYKSAHSAITAIPPVNLFGFYCQQATLNDAARWLSRSLLSSLLSHCSLSVLNRFPTEFILTKNLLRALSTSSGTHTGNVYTKFHCFLFLCLLSALLKWFQRNPMCVRRVCIGRGWHAVCNRQNLATSGGLSTGGTPLERCPVSVVLGSVRTANLTENRLQAADCCAENEAKFSRARKESDLNGRANILSLCKGFQLKSMRSFFS